MSLKEQLLKVFENQHFHGHPGFYELLAQMAELHSQKNHDYAGKGTPLRNFHKSASLGVPPWIGVLVRLTDKWSRIESFAKQGTLEVSDEKIEDTLMDNAVYSLLAILLRREESNTGTQPPVQTTTFEIAERHRGKCDIGTQQKEQKEQKATTNVVTLLYSLLGFVRAAQSTDLVEEAREFEASIESVLEQDLGQVAKEITNAIKAERKTHTTEGNG